MIRSALLASAIIALAASVHVSANNYWDSDQSQGKQKATDLNNMISNYTSKSAIRNNLQNPLATDQQLTTLDGTEAFDAQIGCQASNAYLRLTAAPTGSGDVKLISIEQDTTLDGEMNSVTVPPWNISGACANGFINCEAGTFNEDTCISYKWVANSHTHQIGIQEVPLSDLGGCYCINNACGTNLVWKNMQRVLGNLGSGMAAALSKNSPFFSIASSAVSDTSITFYGSEEASCANQELADTVSNSQLSDLTAYKNNNYSFKSAGAASANSNELATQLQTSQFNTDAGSEHKECSLTRNIGISETVLEDIIGYNMGSGDLTTCGADCLYLTLGKVGNNYWAGNCTMYEQDVSFYIKDPSKIKSATLLYAKFDDWMQAQANGTVIWSGPYNNWDSKTDRPPGKCELSTSWEQNINVDFLQYVQQEGNINFKIRTEVTGNGEGYIRAEVKVDTSCTLNSDEVTNTCTPYEDDKNCVLIKETVDGVAVIDNYIGTGISPLPSERNIAASQCSFDVTRNWWEKKRTYVCSSDTDYQLDKIFTRTAEVKNSVANGDSQISDLRYSPGSNSPTSASVNVNPYFAFDQQSCIQYCKVRRATPQNSVGTTGVTGSISTTPQVYEFEYKECAETACPVSDGEEVVLACSCESEFADASAMMQAIRQAGQGLVCTTGELQSMDGGLKSEE